jgi:hypothetical protein
VRKSGSRRETVFVDQSAEAISTFDLVWLRCGCETDHWLLWIGRSQVEGSVWPVAVVMVEEDAERSFEMLAVDDEEPVEALRADGAHEALGDGVRLRR